MESLTTNGPHRSLGQGILSPAPHSLIDPRFDLDSCGVGFVASTAGGPTHSILELALTALGRLAHRGATASDGKSSDGVGLMTSVPRAMLLKAAGLTLAEGRTLGVGMVFLPTDELRTEAALERCLQSHDLEVLGWRDVPVNTAALGRIALGALPRIRQVFIADTVEGDTDPMRTMERRLYLSRKQFERMQEQGTVSGYLCSLSTQTLVYKAMCSGSL